MIESWDVLHSFEVGSHRSISAAIARKSGCGCGTSILSASVKSQRRDSSCTRDGLRLPIYCIETMNYSLVGTGSCDTWWCYVLVLRVRVKYSGFNVHLSIGAKISLLKM